MRAHQLCAHHASFYLQVDVFNIEHEVEDYLEEALTAVYHILLFEEDQGHILVFLTGEEVHIDCMQLNLAIGACVASVCSSSCVCVYVCVCVCVWVYVPLHSWVCVCLRACACMCVRCTCDSGIR